MIKYGKLVERIVDNVNALPTKIVDGKPWYVLNLSSNHFING